MTRLRACETCARHVFVTETRCPFCAASLTALAARAPTRVQAGMSRAQRIALAAAVVGQTALIGCADDPEDGTIGGAGGMSGIGASGMGSSGSGAAGMSNAGSGTAAVGGGMVVPVYGAPVAGDPSPGGSGGGAGGSGGMSGNAGQGGAGQGAAGEGMAMPVYGAPLPQDGGMDEGPMPVPLYGASAVPMPEE